MKKTTLILLAFLLASFTYQSFSEMLVGTWKCYHKELKNGVTKGIDIISGEEFELTCNDLVIKFNKDNSGWESAGGLTFKYAVADSLLQMGNRVYVIENLTKKELTIREYDALGVDLHNIRLKLKKED